jgi:hypothetical protein
MAEPYNYNIASPMDAFQKAFAFGTAIDQQQREEQAARERQVQQLAEQQKVQSALQSILEDRSPENIARNILLVPSIKEQVAASESVLNEAERTAANQLRSEVIGLFKAGNRDAARARLAAQAEGYRNTPGKEKQAAAAEALLKTFDIDPESVIMPMTIQLAQSDEKLYKNLFENAELTAFQKNLKAAGIDPESPRGIALSEAFAINQADPLVEMETPSGGKFVGPRSEYFNRYGGNAPAPTVKALPAIGEIRNGYKFNGGDPANKDNWSKVGSSGGQTATPSGNFQG